jgi:hypothetical protein
MLFVLLVWADDVAEASVSTQDASSAAASEEEESDDESSSRGVRPLAAVTSTVSSRISLTSLQHKRAMTEAGANAVCCNFQGHPVGSVQWAWVGAML